MIARLRGHRSRMVLLAGVVAAGLASILATGTPSVPAPAAVTPVIDKIYAYGQFYTKDTVAVSYCQGDLYKLPTASSSWEFVLFITNVPNPSDIEVAVDDVARWTDPSAPFGALPAYKAVVDTTKTPPEWRVSVSTAKAGPIVLRVRNVSHNPALTGTAKISAPALLQISTTTPKHFLAPGCGSGVWMHRAVPGGWIAFTSNATGRNEIWAMRGDDSWGPAVPDIHQISTTSGRQAVISPPDVDGASIGVAFENMSNNYAEIHGGSIDDLHSGWIVGDAANPASQPTWVTNTDLAFLMHRNIVDNVAAHPPTLTSSQLDAGPVASPDGSRIAFLRAGDPNSPLPSGKLHIMNADGTGVKNLTGFIDPALESEPVFSPDGSRIAFIRYNRLWVIDANNTPSATAQGTDLGGSFCTHPSWSPDGTSVAVEAGPDATHRDISIVDVSSKAWRQVTTTGNNFTPAWSPHAFTPLNPNDTRIAFVSTRDGHRQIYMMDVNGGNLRNLSHRSADDFDIVWR